MKSPSHRIRQPASAFFGNDRVLIGLISTIAFSLACCGSSRDRAAERDLREEGRLVFGSPSSQIAPAGDEPSPAQGMWSIILESIPGESSQSQAQSRAAEIARELGRPDVGVRTTASGSAVVLGRYDRIDSPQARADLEWVRSLQVGGRRMFARVFLAPPRAVSDPGRVPELSLEMARATFGSRARYTLQIGVYELPDREEAKRAAEQAALALRQDGALAFYHHGPWRSMVTVGVFNENDLDDNFNPKNPTLIALMQSFPRNLLNGHEVIERRGDIERTQSSLLVTIPN